MSKESKILSKLSTLLTEGIEVPGRGYEYRASNLPFCPRAMAIDNVLQERNEAPDGERTHKMESIFSMGHGFHSATQHWLGAKGILFGHWRCQAPLDVERYKALRVAVKAHSSDPILGPALRRYLDQPVCSEMVRGDYLPGTKHAKVSKCPRCGNSNFMLWSYVEYKLNDPKTGMSAHPDGVLPKFKAILELKTTASKYMKGRKEPNWEHWIYQASVYGSLLREQENIDVKRIVLIYVGRENIEHKIFVRPIMKHVLSTTRQSYFKAKEQIKLKILPKGVCTSQDMAKWEMDCRYAGMCFHPKLSKQLGLVDP